MTTRSPEQSVLTPTVGRVVKRALFWAVVAVFAVAIGIVALATVGSTSKGAPLDPTSASPGGSMAVAEVLRQQGVAVVAASTLLDARAAVNGADDTTVLVYDRDGILDDSQLREAMRLSNNVIVVDPTFTQLRVIAPEVALAGRATGELTAQCDLPAAARAGTVSGEASGYRVVGNLADTTACFGRGDGVFSLVQVGRDRAAVTLLGLTDALTNEHVIDSGNAALALNLLGSRATLIWYIPTVADVPDAGAATLGELTPPWVTPVMALLVLTFVAAAFWRGRRFGPLVVENLPVIVRSSETMVGRARLYERSSSRLRALDALRMGAIQRLAVLCGQPRSASVDDVVSAVAAVTGAQRQVIRNLLVDSVPATDADLVALSDALLVLERDVAAAARP